MTIFLVIVIVVLALAFFVSSAMQSYATAQQAQAVIETAKVAQTATIANVFTIIILSLVLLLIFAGIVYLVIKLNRKPRQPVERRKDRLEAARRYGAQLQVLKSNMAEIPDDQADFVVADDEQVEAYVDSLFEDW